MKAHSSEASVEIPPSGDSIPRQDILGMKVAVTSRRAVVGEIGKWAAAGESRYICVANVHMCMETFDAVDFRAVVNGSDLTVPDGLPLVWVQRLQGHAEAEQVRGEDLTRDVCAFAEENGVPVGLYGGTSVALQRLREALTRRFPALVVGYACSPPFRELAQAEEDEHLQEMRASGIRILFVGLGCPKQERWMAARRGSVPAVMIGVGAAFDFISGVKRPAPRWMRRAGLEWLYRLKEEPRRLWRRYLRHNPRFVWHAAWSLIRNRPADRDR